jgi:hypothetical protein
VSEGWDAKPVWMSVHGQTKEMFLKSALAKALNRQLVTIRSWEHMGVLSKPRLRNYRGRWLYSRDQIEDLIKLAGEEGLMDPNLRKPFTERFKKEANKICKRKIQ